MFNNKKTKIVATLGPATSSYDAILSLVNAGANVFRLNFSHGTLEQKLTFVQYIRDINHKFHHNIAILADLQGPKLRVRQIKDNHLVLQKGDLVNFTSKPVLEGTKDLISVSYDNLAKEIRPGEHILLDDGKIAAQIQQINSDGIIISKIIQGGVLSSNKGFNLPDTQLHIPALTSKDMIDLDFILEHELEWVALSFVRSEKDIFLLKNILEARKSKTKIIAKIEKPEAVSDTNINGIINTADGIMIARGDLGVEIPIEKVPHIQKQIIKKCIHRSKPVIVATQMMESMMEHTKPNRSEVSDVANAVLEGTDAVMLSSETATGKNPTLVVEMMSKIILQAETNGDYYYDRGMDLVPQPDSPYFLSDAICYNTCKIAQEIKAKLILGMTQSGRTAFTLSSYRPSTSIIIFANNHLLVKQLSLSWGVHALYYPQNIEGNIDDIISEQVEILKQKGLLSHKEVIVTTGSIPVRDQLNTNMLKIHVTK